MTPLSDSQSRPPPPRPSQSHIKSPCVLFPPLFPNMHRHSTSTRSQASSSTPHTPPSHFHPDPSPPRRIRNPPPKQIFLYPRSPIHHNPLSCRLQLGGNARPNLSPSHAPRMPNTATSRNIAPTPIVAAPRVTATAQAYRVLPTAQACWRASRRAVLSCASLSNLARSLAGKRVLMLKGSDPHRPRPSL